MEFELKELVIGKESLSKLLTADLAVSVSYKLGKIATKIAEELNNYEKKRIELVKKYGETSVKEGKIEVLPENQEKFMAEIEELLGIKVNLDVERVKLSQLGDIKLNAVDMANLSKFVEE